MWSHGSFSFKDLLDIVNPLQHLPVVGSIYRYLTGDEPSVGTRIIGDGLYGGPIGFGVSVASNALLTSADGKDLGERVLADVFGSHDHDSDTTLGKPQVAGANSQPATPAPMPEWMASAGTPDGQPRTPAPANQQNASTRTASVTPPTKPMGYVEPSRAAAAPASRSIASAAMSLPTSPAMSPAMSQATPPAAVQQPLVPAMSAQAQSVPMNQLFRSAPAAAPTPEQAFGNQAAQFQRQISQGRGSNGAVLNNHPIPLELSSNLLPVMPSGGHLALGPDAATSSPQTGQQPGQPNATPATSAAPASSQATANQAQASKPDQKAIAQKMMDALDKYEQLKKQEQQQDNASKADQAKLDLSL